jgi:hypothetical protein
VCVAAPAASETKLVCWNRLLVDIGVGMLPPPPQAGNAAKRHSVAHNTAAILALTGKCLLASS